LKPLALSLVAFACALAACRTPLGPTAGVDAIELVVIPFGVSLGSPPPPFDVARALAAELAATDRYDAVAVSGEPPHAAAWTDVDVEAWRNAGSDYVVVGVVGMVHDGGHELEFLVVDTRSGFSVVGYQVQSAPDELAKTVRGVADIVHQRLTGEQAASAARGRPRVAEK
jgi:Tol biopolymer transport system component